MSLYENNATLNGLCNRIFGILSPDKDGQRHDFCIKSYVVEKGRKVRKFRVFDTALV